MINIKKIIPPSTTIATHPRHLPPTATIIEQQGSHAQHHQLEIQPTHHISQNHPQVQSIVTTHPGGQQTINLMGLRGVQITEQKPMVSRIKYSRGKIITPQGTTTANVQIIEEPQEHMEIVEHHQHHELTEGSKYEISEIDLNNPQASAAIISDLVKYAEIDDIELPDGTKIGIGFAPTEIGEHMQTQAIDEHGQAITITQNTPQLHHIVTQHAAPQQHHTLQLQDQDDATTSVDASIMSAEGITVHETHPQNITKSYTILTSRPLKVETGSEGNTTTTYELALSDSSMGAQGDDSESKYVCRHCGKKYRWKSTLRRHENVECGGKEPCHPCPHCSYKAKQRGNLGVHVRKHHPDKPQLESKRGRKI